MSTTRQRKGTEHAPSKGLSGSAGEGLASMSKLDDVVTRKGQSADSCPVDETAVSEDDMDEVSTEGEGKGQRIGRQNDVDMDKVRTKGKGQSIWRQIRLFMQWPVELGVLVLVVVLSVLGIFVYILFTNANLTSRIAELEQKILIDKDIEKLQDNIKILKSTSSVLKSTVDKMNVTVPKLVADVKKLDKTFEKLEPKVDRVDETVSTLEPKVGKMDETVGKLEPKVEKLEETVGKLEPKVEKLEETVGKLEPKVEKLEETVGKLEPKVEKLEETVGKLEPKVEKFSEIVVKLDPKVEKLDETVGKLEPKVGKLEETVGILEPKVEKLEETVGKLEPKVGKLEETVRILEPKVEKLEETVGKLEPKVGKLEETVRISEPKNEKLEKTVGKLEPIVEKMDKTVKKLEPKVEKLDETVITVDGRVEKLDNKVSGTEKLRENVTEIRDLVDNLGNYSWKKLPESLNRLDNLELTSRSQYSYIYLLLLMTVGLTLWSLYTYSQMPGMKNALVNQQYELTSQSGDQTPSVPEESYRPVGSVLDSIQRSTLARQICVVSFYSETKAFHMRLVESACSGELSKVDKVGSLVSNHETIPKLPRAKIILVFVDFNERDIILEHPDREIGDLRMTTVQGARKMGGDVFVVYVKDKGSQNLSPDHLYNERLRSIITHPELSVLSGKQRVLTTYDEFTMFQRTHLAKSFMRTLQR